MQSTVSAIHEFTYYQFRKVHHFSIIHAFRNNNHNTFGTNDDLPTTIMSYALLHGVYIYIYIHVCSYNYDNWLVITITNHDACTLRYKNGSVFYWIFLNHYPEHTFTHTCNSTWKLNLYNILTYPQECLMGGTFAKCVAAPTFRLSR